MAFRPILAAVLLFLSTGVAAQTYPSKPVTLVVPVPPGGVVDTSARLVGDPLTKLLGQPVVIDNKRRRQRQHRLPAAWRARRRTATRCWFRTRPTTSATRRCSPSCRGTQKDLVPVALIAAATNVITVHPSVPANNLKEFIAYAEEEPRQGQLRLAGQRLAVARRHRAVRADDADTEMTHVPYKGSGAAIQDVLAGQVQVFITTPPSVMGHVQAGKLKALAVTSKTRHPMLPERADHRRGRPARASSWRPGSACSRRPARRRR